MFIFLFSRTLLFFLMMLSTRKYLNVQQEEHLFSGSNYQEGNSFSGCKSQRMTKMKNTAGKSTTCWIIRLLLVAMIHHPASHMAFPLWEISLVILEPSPLRVVCFPCYVTLILQNQVLSLMIQIDHNKNEMTL